MRVHLTVGLIGAMALSACQIQAPGGTAKKPAAVAAKPTAASPVPAAEGPIVGVPLSGTVQIDAAYMVSAGAGVVAAGGANVVAAGAGNVVAAGAGNLIGTAAGNFRTLAADAPAIGTILPVQGMQVQAVDMATGQPIGKPVTTDARGAFKLGVPESLKDNVLLLASVPGSTDARLTYALVTAPAGDADRTIDEDTATVTRYMRRCMVSRFASLLAGSGANGSVDVFVKSLNLPKEAALIATPALSEVQKKAQSVGVGAMSEADRRLIAQNFCDALLAKVKLSDVKTDPALFGGKGAVEPAIETLVTTMRDSREATLAKMKGDRDFFSRQAYIKAASRPWEIKRPSDLSDFLVEEIMANAGDSAFGKLREIYVTIGLKEEDGHRAERAAAAVAMAMGKVIMFDATSRQEALKAFDRKVTK